MSGRYTFIDGLRGAAAAAVVLFHALRGNHVDFMPTEVASIAVLGEGGVAIFFVISGFVIMHSMFRAKVDPAYVGGFILRRSIRLEPPYWVAIALTIGLSYLASAFVPGRPAPEYSIGQLIAHLYYGQELLGYMHINPVFWTLCYEVQFYLVLALVLMTRSTALLILVFGVSLLWPTGLLPEVRGLFVNLFYSFLLGVGAYFAWVRPGVRPWFLAYIGIVLIASLVDNDLFALIASASALLLVSTAIKGRLHDTLNWRWLQFLGAISYSLYLTHNPITGATFRVWYMIAGHSVAAQAAGLVLSAVACVVFAWIMYLLVERPCIAFARSITRARLRAPPRPITSV
ncbi:acyltransferase [Corticibacterium sp. UT-5YL-CI-8]|nr:acyltransferase [Tianweitania sp. UT-5YL-CI-8]